MPFMTAKYSRFYHMKCGCIYIHIHNKLYDDRNTSFLCKVGFIREKGKVTAREVQ
jgi:hypothetical protein